MPSPTGASMPPLICNWGPTIAHMPVFQLDTNEIFFPPAFLAEEDGLLAIGGDLSPARLLTAYSCGVFPWFMEDGVPFWFSPDPRMLLYTDRIKVSKSLRVHIRKTQLQVTFNQAFEEVIAACSSVPRPDQDGTWINDSFRQAYTMLHHIGYAHSVEVWQEGALVGGLYGVGMGRYFCGESMFSKAPNASKVALVHLAERMQQLGAPFIDCQVYTPHLESMGAEEYPRDYFLSALNEVIGPKPNRLKL